MPITRQQFQLGATIALISAVVGVLSSVVTLYTQISSILGSYVSMSLQRDFAPVGTIVSSVLPPPLFAQVTGEIEGDVLAKRRWILADGTNVIGTEYARKTNNSPVPDLRGMFVRGVDPRGNRKAGDVENYATARPNTAFGGTTQVDGVHSHSNGMVFGGGGDKYNAGGRDYFVATASRTGNDGSHTHNFSISTGGDEETRPKNIGVFFYIKIN